MSNKHQPNPEFLARLEWRLMSEMRRRKLFASSPARSPLQSLVRIAALVLFSALLGVAGVKAAQGWESAEEWRLAISRAEIAVELSVAKVELAEQFYAERVAASRAGTIDSLDLAISELHLEKLRMEARLLGLRLQELHLSGEEPQGELDSPLVAGRDFVKERFENALHVALKQQDVGRRFVEQAQKRFEAGVADGGDLRNAGEQLEWASQEVERLQQMLELRRQFVEEGVDPRQIEARSQLEEALRQYEQAVKRLEAGSRIRRRRDAAAHSGYDLGVGAQADRVRLARGRSCGSTGRAGAGVSAKTGRGPTSPVAPIEMGQNALSGTLGSLSGGSW